MSLVEAHPLRVVFAALIGLLALSGIVGRGGEAVSPAGEPVAAVVPLTTPAPAQVSPPKPTPTPTPAQAVRVTPPAPPRPIPALPGGDTSIFGGNQFLVAYYGTAQTGALGVLGETGPAEMNRRLLRAAAPFRAPGRPIQTVYELIVTVADAGPGRFGAYSHDIPRAEVQRYIAAAHHNDALLLLDLQPGRTDFLTVAKRWEWALKDPWVGLALDPEWRMGPHEVPARVVGHVPAREVNTVSGWLSALVVRDRLPQKLFLLHEFRTSMIAHLGRVVHRPGLAMVQHVDGFGTPGQKLSTYDAVARPDLFTMGFKLFYDEDVHRLGPRGVFHIRPRVRFVSFQ